MMEGSEMIHNLQIVQPVAGVENVKFRADRAELCGTLHKPAGPPRALVVLHGATGVPHRYYRHFAAWLSEQGYACLTYDYRDFGASSQGPVKRSKATMAEWGIQDQSAAQCYIEARFPDVPVWVIGHSLGGLMVPFQSGASRIKRLITVASGPVHIKDHPWPYRGVAAVFWYGPGAWATRVLGYLPAKALRVGRDLPAGVYWQWRRWCTTQGFYLGDVGHDLPVPDWRAFTGDMKVVAVKGDAMVPPAAVWRGMQNYPEANKRQMTVRPEDYGLKNVGHIGAFAPQNAAIWPSLIDEH